MPTYIKFKIGADPEWMATSRDRLASATAIEASTFLGNRKSRVSSLNSDCSCPSVLENMKLGADGSGRPFEVRPDPDEDPIGVVQNISNILKESVDADPGLLDLDWFSGPFKHGWPLGGHIHFGLYGQSYNSSGLIQALDDHLAAMIALVEGVGGKDRRNHYGRPGDARDQTWGIEYRTPSSWLVSPYVAAACLCLAKTVAHEYLNNSRFQWHRHSMSTDIYGSPSLILTNSIKDLRKLLPNIWEDITKMEMYKEYKGYIDILNFLATNNLTWEPKCGMKAAWGIVSPVSAMPSRVSLSTIWENNK